jgi:protein-tyrosine phosphatase
VPRSRRLDWEALLNARDLGGLPAAGGRTTRFRAVVRCDSLSHLTSQGRAGLLGYGVRTVIDLRLPSEVEREPNPFALPDGHGVAFHNLSFIDPAATPPGDRATLADDYTGMLRRFAPQVAAVVAAVAGAPEGGVVVHCAAGKDRTGLISGLLLSLAGVPVEVIAEDYALTEANLRPHEQRWLDEGPGDRAERVAALEWGRARAEVMAEVLADTRDRYGGVERYLASAGVQPAAIDRVRRRLLDA